MHKVPISAKHSLFKGNRVTFMGLKQVAWLYKWAVQMGELAGWSNDKLQHKLKLNIVI